MTNALAGKQPTIGDGDLTIARTDGLQTALDGKQSELSATNRLDASLLVEEMYPQQNLIIWMV